MADEKIHPLVFFGSGSSRVQVLWRDFLEALPKLNATQQAICRQHLATGGAVKMVRELESERDAAIARAEAAELNAKNYADAADVLQRLVDRLRPVVEAARNMALAFCTVEEYPAHKRLEEALRALDAAHEAKPVDDSKPHWATVRALQNENENLRSALARAEEARDGHYEAWQKAEKRVEHWKAHGLAHEDRATRERDRCDEAERGLANAHDVLKRLRSELQAEKLLRWIADRIESGELELP